MKIQQHAKYIFPFIYLQTSYSSSIFFYIQERPLRKNLQQGGNAFQVHYFNENGHYDFNHRLAHCDAVFIHVLPCRGKRDAD